MPDQTIGGFRVIRELGRGGMGIVYEAEQASPRRSVALKVLPPEFAHSPGVAARFEQEANRMAMLDGHPRIATVYAAGEDNGVAYFAMQLLTGGDLEQRLRREGRIDQKEAAAIAAKVADALDHAHERGIVHRDVKPANIMFNAQGEPVVTDFGIAQAADQVRVTLTGMSVCTPEYASPEHMSGNPVDGRSDLYSLGVVLYRMVTGRPMFDCANPLGWAMKHRDEIPQAPRVWCPELHDQLQAAIMKCLQKEPSGRFANGAELATALRGINWATTSDAPPPLPAPTPRPTVVLPPKQQTVVVRNKPPTWPYIVGGLGFMALLVSVVLMTGQPKQATQVAPPPAAGAPVAAPAPATAPAGEAKWMENPAVADIPDSPVKGMVNGVAFEAKTMRVIKGEKNSKLELLDKAADTPTGMVSDATEVKLEFVLEPGKPGEFVKAMADKDPENTDGWYSYEQKDGTPMTMNSDWSVALKIDEWTTAKDPADPKVLGQVKGKIFLVYKDDPKTFVAGTFEGPYCE